MPTPEQIQQAIRDVTDQCSFIDRLLRETLGWPIHLDFRSIEDITYEWTDDELNTIGLSRDILTGPVLQMQSLEQDHEQPWGIFILEFANITPLVTGRGLTGPLRKVLRGLVPKRRDRQANLPAWNRENLLFICTHQYRYFRFAYFKTAKEKGHAEPLTTFSWEPGVPPRTVCEFNLGHLCWPEEPSDADKWVIDWSKAFDVEAVTKKFYDDYEQVFRDLQGHLDLTDAEDKKMFAQMQMNRLMFLRFVERKGWLKFGNVQDGPQNYLKELFEAGPVGSISWYRSRLMPLFFEGMAVPGHQQDDAIGQVPYLNGGLFERTSLDDRVTDVPDSAFEPILGQDGLFYRYNFTIEESTPLDIDVAVDPEMLGKVFEKLVTTRRQKGSYYTPRTVVSFMCRETLKGYLGSYYAPLIDEGSVERIGIPEARDLLGRLASVEVVDPACGSGAYLLGMLHELFRITNLLDTRAETETPHDAYHRKLTIIQNNLYGVDIDEFAINIAFFPGTPPMLFGYKVPACQFVCPLAFSFPGNNEASEADSYSQRRLNASIVPQSSSFLTNLPLKVPDSNPWVAPVSKITYYGKVDKIEPYENTGKYKIYLQGNPIKLAKPVGLGKNPHLKPQGPKYTKLSVIQEAKTLDDIWG